MSALVDAGCSVLIFSLETCLVAHGFVVLGEAFRVDTLLTLVITMLIQVSLYILESAYETCRGVDAAPAVESWVFLIPWRSSQSHVTGYH